MHVITKSNECFEGKLKSSMLKGELHWVSGFVGGALRPDCWLGVFQLWGKEWIKQKERTLRRKALSPSGKQKKKCSEGKTKWEKPGLKRQTLWKLLHWTYVQLSTSVECKVRQWLNMRHSFVLFCFFPAHCSGGGWLASQWRHAYLVSVSTPAARLMQTGEGSSDSSGNLGSCSRGRVLDSVSNSQLPSGPELAFACTWGTYRWMETLSLSLTFTFSNKWKV